MLFTYRLKPAKKKVPHKDSIFPKEYIIANYLIVNTKPYIPELNATLFLKGDIKYFS